MVTILGCRVKQSSLLLLRPSVSGFNFAPDCRSLWGREQLGLNNEPSFGAQVSLFGVEWDALQANISPPDRRNPPLMP